jgi:hypothetical protein
LNIEYIINLVEFRFGQFESSKFVRSCILLILTFSAYLMETSMAALPYTDQSPIEVPGLWPYHAILMVAGFALLFLGMLKARKRKGDWLKAHKARVIPGLIFALAGLSMAFYMVSAASQEHYKVPHAYLGTIVILLLLINPILGHAQFKIASKREQLRRIHHFNGRLALSLMAINMIFGLLIVSAG